MEELAQKLKDSEELQSESLERFEQEKRELQSCLQDNMQNRCNDDEHNLNDSMMSKSKLDLDRTVDLPGSNNSNTSPTKTKIIVLSDGELILKKIEDLPEITLKEASQFTEEVDKLKQRLETMEEDLHKSQQVVDDLIGIQYSNQITLSLQFAVF
jgi:hypothetical protein